MKNNRLKAAKNLIVIIFLLIFLTITAIVIIPTVIKDINSKEILSEQETEIAKAAEKYFDDHTSKLPKRIGDITEITLNDLIYNGYINYVYDTDGNICYANTSTVTIKKIDDIKYEYYIDLFCEDYASLETWTNWSAWSTDDPPVGENIQSENILFYKLKEGDINYGKWSAWQDYDLTQPLEKDGYEYETRTVYRYRDTEWKWYYNGKPGSSTTTKEYAFGYYLTAPSEYPQKDTSDFITETKYIKTTENIEYTETDDINKYADGYYSTAPSGYPYKDAKKYITQTYYKYSKNTQNNSYIRHYSTGGGIEYAGNIYYGTLNDRGTNDVFSPVPSEYNGNLNVTSPTWTKDKDSGVKFKVCQPISYEYSYETHTVFNKSISKTANTDCENLMKILNYDTYKVSGSPDEGYTCDLSKIDITRGTFKSNDGNIAAEVTNGTTTTIYQKINTYKSDAVKYYAKSCPNKLNSEWDLKEVGDGTLYRYYVNEISSSGNTQVCVPANCTSYLSSPRYDLKSPEWSLNTKTEKKYKYYKIIPGTTEENIVSTDIESKWSETSLNDPWVKTNETREKYKYYKEDTIIVDPEGKIYTTKYSSIEPKGYPNKDINKVTHTDYSAWSTTRPSSASYRIIESKPQVKYRKVNIDMDEDFGNTYYTESQLEKKTGLSLTEIQDSPILEYQKIYLNRYRTRRVGGTYVEPGNIGLKSWLDTLIRCFITIILILYLVIGPHYGDKWLISIFNLVTSALAISEYQLYIWGIASTLELIVIVFNIIILILMIYGNSQYTETSDEEN